MSVLCNTICPMANKEASVMASVPGASIETFPEGFKPLDSLTATPESILLFLEYQNRLVQIMMYEEVGDWSRNGHHTARRLMLTDIPDGAVAKCGLNHGVAEVMQWELGGAKSIVITDSECPYVDRGTVIHGGVSAVVRS